MEAAVTAARIAAGEGHGAVFAPLAMGGAGGLRATGAPPERLARWLDGMESATLKATRQLDAIEAWPTRASAAMTHLSAPWPNSSPAPAAPPSSATSPGWKPMA